MNFSRAGIKGFQPFTDYDKVIDWLRTNDSIWYHAPMDRQPTLIHVVWYKISNVTFEKSEVRLETKGTRPFTVKLTEHFDRFRQPVTAEENSLTPPLYPLYHSSPEPIPPDEERQSGPDAWEGGFAPNH